MYLIYKHTNKVNGLFYIGQTEDTLLKRFACHVNEAFTKLSGHRPFLEAIREFGKNGFDHEIIEGNITTEELANEREIYWIDFYNATNSSIGYNIRKGGGVRRSGILLFLDHILFLDLLKEWNYIKNNALNISPFKISSGSHKLVWWKCNKCKYEYTSNIGNKILHYPKGCAKCINRHRPDFTKEYIEKLVIEYYIKYTKWPNGSYINNIDEDKDGGRCWSTVISWINKQQNLNWNDFLYSLGKPKILSYNDAKKVVHNYKLTSQKTWVKFTKTKEFKTLNIPSDPARYYDLEWEGLGKWLNTNSVKSGDILYKIFDDVKKFAKENKITSRKIWRSAVLPIDIPRNVKLYYKSEWHGWSDFLGTGRKERKKSIGIIINNIKYKSIAEAAKIFNIKPNLLRIRYNKYPNDLNKLFFDGNLLELITTKITFNDKTQTLKKWSIEFGYDEMTLYFLLKNGKTIEECYLESPKYKKCI